MKLSNGFFYTLRENSKDEDSVSSNLLTRSGMIKKTSAGVYMFMPLGLKVLDNIKKIVKEEMDNAGAQEMLMPSLISSDVYESSGRLNLLGNSMFKLNDRNSHPMCLGPTHEELFTIAAKMKVRSYKDLGFTLYQQADKFRDEARPRYGLIRVKEFIMKDAYSFDRDEKGLDNSYSKMFDAYKKIMDRCGLDYKVVRADTGVMGGSLSEEFQAVTDIGEDYLVLCDKCDYASNIEVSEVISKMNNEIEKDIELVDTKDNSSIEDVCNYLNISPKNTVKAMLMNVNDELVCFFIRGDREFNETKACKALGVNEINFADDMLISRYNCVPGYTGPIGLNSKVIIDKEVLNMKNFVVGANKLHYHYINCNVKDINYDEVYDISNVVEGDICPKCSGKLYFKKGIEVGNTFKLGSKYSKMLGLTYLDENNKENDVVMGCYGIGVGRILAAYVEQHNDENGIIFNNNIAPYKVCIVACNVKDNEQLSYANKLYESINNMGISCLLDDRDERVGVKFKDMDLIGIPLRITIGKSFVDNKLEVKFRNKEDKVEVNFDDIIDFVKNNTK